MPMTNCISRRLPVGTERRALRPPSLPLPHRHTAVEHDPGNARRNARKTGNKTQDETTENKERRKERSTTRGRGRCGRDANKRREVRETRLVTVCTLGAPIRTNVKLAEFRKWPMRAGHPLRPQPETESLLQPLRVTQRRNAIQFSRPRLSVIRDELTARQLQLQSLLPAWLVMV